MPIPVARAIRDTVLAMLLMPAFAAASTAIYAAATNTSDIAGAVNNSASNIADVANSPAGAGGNLQKTLFENTTMTSGLYFVVAINVLTSWLGFLFYRYIVLRQAGLLSPDEIALLRKYPPVRSPQSYTPEEAFVRGAPPLRWTGWHDFFTSSDESLSRDAQVYLLFQRTCMATTAVCAIVSSVLLLPSYWFGGAFKQKHAPVSLAALLRSDRGIFERFTSHNLQPDSPLLVLQLPVVAVAAFCVVILYTVVRTASGEHLTLDEWLAAPLGSSSAFDPPASDSVSSPYVSREQSGRPQLSRQQQRQQPSNNKSPNNIAQINSSFASMEAVNPPLQRLQRVPASPVAPVSPRSGIHRHSGWTLFARGLPSDIRSREELIALLNSIYPGQIRSVELVCKGRMSEARLLRAISTARNRLDYVYDTTNLDSMLASPDVTSTGADSPLPPPEKQSDDTTEGQSPATSPPSAGILIWSRAQRIILGRGRKCRGEMITDLAAEIKSLESDLASRKAEPVRDFLGCAFITVRTADVASSLVHDFPEPMHNSQRRPMSSVNSSSGGSSVFAFLRVDNLYRGMVMLMPVPFRQWVMSSSTLAPRSLVDDEAARQALLTGRTSRGHVTREIAVSRLRAMKAERAPKSGDIVWNNVGISYLERTCREMLVQIFVFAFLILFTSPVAMLTAMRLVFAEVSLLSDMAGTMANGSAMLSEFGGNHGGYDAAISSANHTVTMAGASVVRIATMAVDNGNMSLLATSFPNLDFEIDGENAASDISMVLMQLLPSSLSSNTLFRSILLAYIPVVLLAFVFALVPTLLRMISGLEGYPTHSAREVSILRKTVFYYAMNSVVLPSLALNTASEFLEMVYNQSNGGANVYNALPILTTLFSGDIAYFLCNYMVQLALTGSVVWLCRLPNSFSMMVRRRLAVTPLEMAEAKCTSIFDFPRHYAYGVTVMSMCLLFGFMAPLMWGFGFMYFVCKHGVDTYLLRYVHPRSHIDGRLPRLGVHFVLVWTCMCQLSLAVVFYLQSWHRVTLVTVLMCAMTVAACVGVAPRYGNRILGMLDVVPRIRDMIILKLTGTDRDDALFTRDGRLPLQTSSSTSSSTASLSEVVGGAPLLSHKGSKELWPVTLEMIEDGRSDDENDDDVDEIGPLQVDGVEDGFGSGSAYGATA
jgi:Calcium-dependent channel, 7TM region, putative phosphate